MRGDVLAGYVRYEALEAIAFRVEDEASLLFLFAAPESFRSGKQPELQWHVESRQTRVTVRVSPADVVNPKPQRRWIRKDADRPRRMDS